MLSTFDMTFKVIYLFIINRIYNVPSSNKTFTNVLNNKPILTVEKNEKLGLLLYTLSFIICDKFSKGTLTSDICNYIRK